MGLYRTKDDLRQVLLDAKTAYYAGNPVMSDAQYDLLEAMWREAYPDEELVVDAGQKEGVFIVPYLSLDKVDFKALERWVGRVSRENYVVLPKIDGVSMELHFAPDTKNKARLTKALTRGGHDVTKQFQAFAENFWDEILYLGEYVVVRGEVFFEKDDLSALKEVGFTALRNAAAGLMNPSRKDFNVGDIPKLKFLVWRWVNSPCTTHKESLDTLAQVGFPTTYDMSCTLDTIKKMEDDLEFADNVRNQYLFELDGLVIFRNRFSDWIADGDTKYYRNAMAWKFASPVKESKIEKVEWSLGVSGYVTPVAVVEPVEVGGVVVTHVNLHNPENMINLKAFPGAIAKIRRAGDVIPHIAEACQYEAPSDGEICTTPENCPRCDTKLHSEGPRIKCINEYCDGQIEGVVYKWVDAHEWKYFSEEAMRDMLPYFKQDYHPLVLIYNIDGHTLNQFMTSGKADRLWKHYQEAVKRTTLATLLASLNIPMIGVKNAEKILEQTEKLVQLPSVLKEKKLNGTISVAEGHLFNWIIMHGMVWLHILNLANQLNVEVQKVKKAETKGRVVITGELPGCTRDEAFLVLKARGYEPSNSLSKTTLYLITENPDTTTTKAQKARKYGVPVISWSEFLKISEL